jgi:hypothetical protein
MYKVNVTYVKLYIRQTWIIDVSLNTEKERRYQVYPAKQPVLHRTISEAPHAPTFCAKGTPTTTNHRLTFALVSFFENEHKISVTDWNTGKRKKLKKKKENEEK